MQSYRTIAIFLDIDGVLTTYSTLMIKTLERSPDLKDHHEAQLNRFAVKRFDAFVDRLKELRLEVLIIISSTWRKFHTLKDLRSMLKNAGLTNFKNIVGVTKEMNTIRGLEIDEWLMDNTDKNINAVLILDDDLDMTKTQIEKFFVLTNMRGTKDLPELEGFNAKVEDKAFRRIMNQLK